MTREQAKQNLIKLGVAEPTEDQVNAYLNQVGGETQREKNRAETYKKDAEKAAELQTQRDEINNQNLSEVEKANKALEEMQNQLAEQKKVNSELNLAKSLAEKGIVGDDAASIIKAALEGDNTALVDAIGKITDAKVTDAVAAREKELLKNTPNPKGAGGDGGNTQTDAEKLVAGIIGAGNGGEKKDSVISHYIN